MFLGILYLLLEPVKRILSALIYLPLIYPLRRVLRRETILRPEYLYAPAFFPLWLFLDDSIRMETGEDRANQPGKYPAWINGLGWTWLKCYWWSAIRNSCVNWNNYAAMKLGRFLSEEDHAGKRNFYVMRTYERGRRPYCEFWLFGRWNQAGWLNGLSPRFEIDLMKRRA